MAATVTQAEKDKRRQQHVTRRQQRGKANLRNIRDLPPPKPGSDERFKEMKIGVFYDQDKTHRHVLATEKLSKDFAPLLASHARQIGFERAEQTICLFDGAVWIYQQVCLALLCLEAILLDFYHLAEHVHATARCCLGEGEAARSWAHDRLTEAKRGRYRLVDRPVFAVVNVSMTSRSLPRPIIRVFSLVAPRGETLRRNVRLTS